MKRTTPPERIVQVDQPNYKEALVMDPVVGHRYWRYSRCCLRYRTVAQILASIAINYLRYYNYLFHGWDYAPWENAFANWRQCRRVLPRDATDGHYCYYYCYCCCRCWCWC